MRHIFKTILLLINLVAVVYMALAGFGGHVDPAVWALPAVALMTFPLALMGVAALIFIDLLFWKRLAFLPFFAILLCGVPVWNFCPLNLRSPSIPEDCREVKLMTYNVSNVEEYQEPLRNDTINRTLSTILADNPDVVCMQEAAPDDPADWTLFRQQADSIVARYPYREHGPGTLAIWSRYPLTNISMRQFSGSRSCWFQGVKVTVGSTELTLYNIHLQSLGLSLADKALYGSLTRRPTSEKLEEARSGFISKLTEAMRLRSKQAAFLRRQIDSIGGGNIVVAGDFNDIEDCWAERTVMGKDMKSVFTAVGFGPEITFNADRLYFNIDHVLTGPGVVPLSYSRGHVNSSDHYPVTVELGIRIAQEPDGGDKEESTE